MAVHTAPAEEFENERGGYEVESAELKEAAKGEEAALKQAETAIKASEGKLRSLRTQLWNKEQKLATMKEEAELSERYRLMHRSGFESWQAMLEECQSAREGAMKERQGRDENEKPQAEKDVAASRGKVGAVLDQVRPLVKDHCTGTSLSLSLSLSPSLCLPSTNTSTTTTTTSPC